MREDVVAILLVEILENVDGVVRIEFADCCRQLIVRQMLDDFETNGFIDLGQRRHVEIVAQQAHQCQPLVRIQQFEQMAHFRFVQARDVVLEEGSIACLDRLADTGQEIDANVAVLVINIELMIGYGGANALVFRGRVHQPPRIPPTNGPRHSPPPTMTA